MKGDSDDGSTSRQIGKKYIVLEFWGYVDGSDLQACGMEVDDPALEYAANVWVIPGSGSRGSFPIKAVLYSAALDYYKVFYFEKDETSIFGEGLPRVIRHSQIAMAAAARMVLDNAACVAGPLLEVNWNLMTHGTDYSSIYPRKIFYREGRGVDAQYPALRVYNIDSHIDELIKIIDLFRQLGDEESTLPTWMIGQMVNNETAQATSGRMTQILASIKDIVKNFDAFTEKIISALYSWNMDFNPRTDIKGDYKCKAKGSSSLIMKEVRMQALAQLSTTLTPEERDYIPEREFLQEKLRAHDINIQLLSDEEVRQIREERSQSVQNQLTLKMMESEVQKNKAQSMSLLTKAKKSNAEAEKEVQTPPEGENPEVVAEDVALLQTERAGKEAQIRRDEESHLEEQRRKEEQHKTDLAVRTSKIAHEIAGKDKTVDHKMKMDEIKTRADAVAKKKSALQKPKGMKSSGGK